MNKQTFPHLLLPDILLGFKNNIIWNDTEQLLLTYQALPKRPAEQSLEQDLEGGWGLKTAPQSWNFISVPYPKNSTAEYDLLSCQTTRFESKYFHVAQFVLLPTK